jgi:hypothetical protein
MPGPWPRIFGSVAALRGRPRGCNPAGSASAPPGRCRPDAGISRTSPEPHTRRANPQAGMRNGAADGCPLFEVCSYRADALAVKSPCPARQDSGANHRHRHRHREKHYASRSSARACHLARKRVTGQSRDAPAGPSELREDFGPRVNIQYRRRVPYASATVRRAPMVSAAS